MDRVEEDLFGNDGIQFLTDLFGSMQTGKRILLHILGAWTVGDGKVESGEEECPSSLMWVKSFGIPQVLEIFVVSENDEWVLCTLQPMPPLF